MHYPVWLDFWNEDEEGLFEEFSSKEDIINYYGNLDKKVIIDKYREEIKIAEKLNAEYAVFHVSNVRTKDCFNYEFTYTDKEVVDATIEIVNEIFKGDHYVYFYSPKDSKSVSSDTGIRSLNKGINDLYFVNLNEKNDDLKEIDLTKYGNLKEIKPTTLIYVRDGKIEKVYKGVNQISNAQEKILEGSWDD